MRAILAAIDANHSFRSLVRSIAAIFVITLVSIAACSLVFARDLDGRYANSPLNSWFDGLASGKGLCCSFADGVSVQDVD
jgi:hypothetical protein